MPDIAAGDAPAGSPGPWEREQAAFVAQFGLYGRAVMVSVCVALAVLTMPVGEMAPTAAVAAAAIAWSWLHVRLATAATPGRDGPLVAADMAVITALCLSRPVTIPDMQTVHGNVWVMVVLGAVAVSYQMTHPPSVGIPIAVGLCCADLAGAALNGGQDWADTPFVVSWILIHAGLARALIRLLLKESRAADRAAARAELTRQQSEVASARGVAERRHLTALQDTVCATLLVASAPGPPVRPEVLRAQAARDLQRLLAGRSETGTADLAAELTEEIGEHPLRVTVRFPEEALRAVWPPAAAALRDSMREALRNVARHAGVDEARVTAELVRHVVVVTIADSGKGFDAARVPPRRYGLRRSIEGRMWEVGGRATVLSRPSHGTTVRLEWPRV
jgi:hypothetical protein